MKLWGGRFKSDMSDEVGSFSESTDIDSRMVLQDIWGSQAHAIMLARQKIISEEDLRQILAWLGEAKSDFLNGKFKLKPELEDVHMNVEMYVIEGAGQEYGGKLHTARSRNDQVLTDSKLYIREQLIESQALTGRLSRVLLELAQKHLFTVMPGYTHIQHAQPITLAFWASAYVSGFLRDLDRLDFAYKNVNSNPLGACALAGSSFEIDRNFTAQLLGFDSVHEHALDVISSRDFMVETLSGLAIIMSELSKISTEIVYWSSFEFGMLELDDSYSSGSSIMPQKKNPCVSELVRGRTSSVYSALMRLLTTLKGLPMGYNRDLQEDKPPLWEAFDVVQASLSITAGAIESAKFNSERMLELVNANFSTATELANFLVRRKEMPFRESHRIVGEVISELIKSNKNFSDVNETKELLKKRNVDLTLDEISSILDPKQAVLNNKSLGGTSPEEVRRMLSGFSLKISEHESGLAAKRDKIELAKKRTDEVVQLILKGNSLENSLASILT